MADSLALRPPSWSALRPLGLMLRALAERRQSGRATLAPERLVIVGNGMVGQRFCERLVENGAAARFRTVVLAEEALPAYDRVHLADLFRGREASDLLLRKVDWYPQNAIDLRLNERVARIDRSARRVVTESGNEFEYDRLVFATGSFAPLPPVTCDDGAELLAYRTLEDVQRIRATVQALGVERPAVAVVGGGLLGIEAARTLQLLGCRVIVVEASSQLLPRQLDPAAARVLESSLCEAGIDLALRARIRRVVRRSRGFALELDQAPDIEADVVVAAVGARARDEVARAAGLRCHARGGIEVDATLTTSDPRIHAIGECAEHAQVPHGLVAPGYAMADILAERLKGSRRRLEAQQAVTRLKLDILQVNVLGNPLAPSPGRDISWQSSGAYRRLVIEKGRLMAAIAVGQWDELPVLQQLLSQGKRIERSRLARFAKHGDLGVARALPLVTSWPDAAVVCQCAGVSCGTLRRAIAAGHSNLVSLARATSASTLCGSCAPELALLCGQPAGELRRTSPTPGLLVAGASALLLGVVTVLAPRVPFAGSIRDQSLDLLWQDPGYKQVTGFVLVAVVVLGLGLPLRKRVARFRLGSYSLWRVAHGALGALGLLVLFGHTGFRLGHNLNLALMLAFLLSAISGATAGILASATANLPADRAWRRTSELVRTLHDYAFWPIPLLAVFHVLKVYYY